MDDRSFASLAEQVLTRKWWVVRECQRESFAAFSWLGICCCVRYNAARGEEMYSAQRIGVLVITGLLLAFMTTANAQYGQRVARGVWGGLHINMLVGARSATIEYDCARGTIDGRPGLDKQGKFEWRGTFTPERGGPIRADDEQRAQPATYSGEVKGTTMTLTMKVAGSDETETFTLEKGKPGELFKCK